MIHSITPRIKFSLMCGLLAFVGAAFASTPADEDRLLLVDRQQLLDTPPSEQLLGQEIWDMHRTNLSRTSMVRLQAETPVVMHAMGERTLIILEGEVQLAFADQQLTLGAGDYVAIPANQTYQMTPSGDVKPILLGFDVPIISMSDSVPGSLEQTPEENGPVIKRQSEIMASPTDWNDPSDRGWTLVQNSEKRVNLVEMFSELKNHSHPDADHSLILLNGSGRVVTPTEDHLLTPGDYLSIPQNIPHKYYVEGDQPALFISFDAPAYDPAKTIYFE